MRGVKPRSSGLLMRLSPGRRGVVPLGCTLAHSPQCCGIGGGAGSWGQMWGGEAHMWMHTRTCSDTRTDIGTHVETQVMSAATCTHQHVRSHRHGHTSTRAWAHTFPQMLLQLAQLPLGRELVDGQGWGAERGKSPHLSHLSSMPQFIPCPKLLLLAPASPLLLSPLGTWVPLTVQGGRQG